MTDYDHGPLDTYEIQWTSGHVERIQAHQVLLPHPDMFGSVIGSPGEPARETHVRIHGEINGQWKLILSAPANEIHSIRLVTDDEEIPEGT